MNKSQVRTRFAPSPTGYLHIGSLRTALYSYLFAKQHNGKFILRLEDTDQKRFVEGATDAIYSGLKWAGVNHDEGPDIGGPFVPYIQSQRLDLYKKYAQELIDKDKAYYCFCDAKTLEEMRNEQVARKQAPKYDRRCLKLSKEEIAQKLAAEEPYVIRMKIPENRTIEINDLVRGKVAYRSEELDDQVLLKSDGYPTYHLAVVVDDHLMQITHVTRTEEWLPSTPKHILLYEYFGWEAPLFAHLPLLLNADKTKMSKRKGDVAVGDYIKKGYLPEAMVNYLAFLGWNPGLSSEASAKGEREKETYSMEELLKDFSLERVHKAGAVFNIEKLNWYNNYYLKQKSAQDLSAFVWQGEEKPKAPEPQITKATAIECERSNNAEEIREKVNLLFNPPAFDKSLLNWKAMEEKDIKESLESSQKIIAGIPEKDFNSENLKNILMEEAAKRGDKGSLLWPLRVSLSGLKNSPPPFDIAEIIGKEKSLARIAQAIKLL
ncbi:MAG TPA: glutamate--tRNA ligase [Candidatus Portnoybacteria bacterium]|nr:glutamate--tRNA ligase [Candidatus Portnoybacteria bacterium]